MLSTAGVKMDDVMSGRGRVLGTEASDIRLQCPRCKASKFDRECVECGFQFHEDHGIIQALPPERVVHYARFIDDYEHIREAEGRGNESDAFYLALPYNDISENNQSQWRIRAQSYECLVERILTPQLKRGSRILDLGAGNCWLSFRLALEGYKLVAVDLLTNGRDGLGAAEHYRPYLSEIFPRFRAEVISLPFAEGQFDAAIFNASFHYAEDSEAALSEALRCVAEDGLVIICDTPWYGSEESGMKMVAERRLRFLQKYGTASNSIQSLEFLTDEQLRSLEMKLQVRWSIYSPAYGLKWAMRPWIAKLRHRREPARFRIYAAKRTPK